MDRGLFVRGALYAALAAPVRVVADVLASFGLPEHDNIPAIRALPAYLHGFVALETARGFGMPRGIEESFDAGIELFIGGVRAAIYGGPNPRKGSR